MIRQNRFILFGPNNDEVTAFVLESPEQDGESLSRRLVGQHLSILICMILSFRNRFGFSY